MNFAIFLLSFCCGLVQRCKVNKPVPLGLKNALLFLVTPSKEQTSLPRQSYWVRFKRLQNLSMTSVLLCRVHSRFAPLLWQSSIQASTPYFSTSLMTNKVRSWPHGFFRPLRADSEYIFLHGQLYEDTVSSSSHSSN